MPQTTPLGISVDLGGESPLDRLPACVLQRKGWLLLVPGNRGAGVDVAAAYESYYASQRFDVEPTLLASMRLMSTTQDGGAADWHGCGAVLMGLDLTALLPAGYGLWVMEERHLRRVASWPLRVGGTEDCATLCRSHHRIRPGETLLLGREELGPILARRRVKRNAGNPARLRRLVSKLAARQGIESVSLGWLHDSAGPVVALEELWHASPRPLQVRLASEKRARLSPVWLAVAIAVLSAVGVYALKRPALPRASWAETITFLLTVDRLGEGNDVELDGLSPPQAE
ncbi:MAG: hypothetical protein ACP5G7_03165 [Anaerolineae bacterium]